MIIGGLDLSKNHYAFVVYDTKTKLFDPYIGWSGSTTILNKWKKACPEGFHIYQIPTRNKNELLELYNHQCRRVVGEQILQIANNHAVEMIALEGYAFSGSYVVQLAETTGGIKDLLIDLEIAIRIHDPLTVKMWAGSGSYGKPEMLEVGRKLICIPDELCKGVSNPAGDIVDAYFLVDLLRTEIDVRKFPLHIGRLNEKQKQVFNRLTKAFPENLLVRPFVAYKQPLLKGAEL